MWQCWLAHVAEVRFCVRRASVRGKDGQTILELHNIFLAKFAAVEQWQNNGYEKPKFHSSVHFAELLDEFGPLRASWCFPWEGYLQARPSYSLLPLHLRSTLSLLRMLADTQAHV